jgi:hypothetical protein
MFICLECEHVFDENEVVYWEEDRGEFWGVSCSEPMSGCPHCGGGYVKTYECDCCHNWISGSYIKTDDGKRYCENCYVVMDLEEEE